MTLKSLLMTAAKYQCHVCKDTGFFIGEDGKEAVCLECQHIDWSAKNNVFGGSVGQHCAWLRSGHSRTTDSISSLRYTGYNIGESNLRSNLSDHKPNPVLPVQENVRLDSQEQPACPYCGVVPFVEEQMHGHYVCMNCHTITVGCCDGECG
jgi:DNA-directed RNA polymerase subunit RPC12/RpoP